MSKYPSQMQDKFNLRFPDGMREAIAERAKANGRSMNSEIIEMISNSLFSSSIGNDAVGYILEMTKQNDMNELSEEERDHLMSMLMQVASKLSVKIEKESVNLRQVLDLISQNKKPT
ncbi:Arc family DNA-binding protein [Rahnella sp. ChDrAdgB13]|uniref:Arc family DNA-binding protein n=1 Tax=Rahnella sp. ChDrAdgB13 TaxID=1850581 RepID=UPI001AD88D36|nr:Arc family DNA-binding protein [Rahnella sp. ChDrAdgB13]